MPVTTIECSSAPVSEGASPGGALANPGGGLALAVLDALPPKADEEADESLKLPMNTAEKASLKNSDEDPPLLGAPKADADPEASASESTGPSKSCARRSASSDSYLVSSTLPLVKKAGSAPNAEDEDGDGSPPPNVLSLAIAAVAAGSASVGWKEAVVARSPRTLSSRGGVSSASDGQTDRDRVSQRPQNAGGGGAHRGGGPVQQ
jgi:hypothetical protein